MRPVMNTFNDKKVDQASINTNSIVTVVKRDTLCDPLVSWLNEYGVDSTDCIISDAGRKQRGVFSSRPILKGERIVRVPLAAMYTLETVHTDGLLSAHLNVTDQSLGHHHVLATAMCLDFREKDSPWQAYYQSLPNTFSHMPLLFNDEALSALSASPVLEHIHQRRFRLKRDYTTLPDSITKDLNISLAEYVRARTWVQSRSYHFKSGEQSHLAMIPLIDLFNHDGVSNAYWKEEKGGFSIWARKDIAIGEEITTDYGSKSLQRFYAHYGFINNHCNGDEVEIELNLKPDDPCIVEKMNVLGIQQPTIRHTLTQNTADTLKALLPVIRIILLPENRIDQIERVFAGEVVTPCEDTKAFSLFVEVLTKKSKEYEAQLDTETIDPNIVELLKREHNLINQYLGCSELQPCRGGGEIPKRSSKPKQTVQLSLIKPHQWPEFMQLSVHDWQRDHIPRAKSLLEGAVFNPEDKRYQLYGIHCENTLVGGVTLQAQGSELWLGGFHLDQHWQNQGIGGLVFDEIIARVINHDQWRVLSLDVEQSNIATRRFYESRGLVVIGYYEAKGKSFWILSANWNQLLKSDSQKNTTKRKRL